jgi:hypothetical protein
LEPKSGVLSFGAFEVLGIGVSGFGFWVLGFVCVYQSFQQMAMPSVYDQVRWCVLLARAVKRDAQFQSESRVYEL